MIEKLNYLQINYSMKVIIGETDYLFKHVK